MFLGSTGLRPTTLARRSGRWTASWRTSPAASSTQGGAKAPPGRSGTPRCGARARKTKPSRAMSEQPTDKGPRPQTRLLRVIGGRGPGGPVAEHDLRVGRPTTASRRRSGWATAWCAVSRGPGRGVGPRADHRERKRRRAGGSGTSAGRPRINRPRPPRKSPATDEGQLPVPQRSMKTTRGIVLRFGGPAVHAGLAVDPLPRQRLAASRPVRPLPDGPHRSWRERPSTWNRT